MAENDKSDEQVVDIFDMSNGDPMLAGEEKDEDEGAAAAAQPETESAIPDKFKGKTLEQVIEMYGNLEKVHGRQGNELGEVRQLANQILQNQVAASTPTTESKTVDSDALLENPVEVINELVSRNPLIQELAGRVDTTQKALTVEALERKHGNLKEIGATEGFQNWVRSSPARLARFQRADAGDLAAADDLLTTFKELQEARSNKQTEARNHQRRALATPSAGSGSSASALNESATKKPVFSKAQIMELRRTDPARYERMQPVIMQAYLDKRVR